MKKLIFKGQIFILLFSCFVSTNVLAEPARGVLSPAFIEGFKSEIANRNFSKLTTKAMAERFKNQKNFLFWESYHKLEQLNSKHYSRIASYWGISTDISYWTKIKALVMSVIPSVFIDSTLKSALTRTEDYVVLLKELNAVGPSSERGFLDYMVKQEVLQVDIMKLALAGEFDAAADAVDDFIQANIDLPSP